MSLLFSDPDTSYYTSRSYYYTGLSSDGYAYVINVFHWNYAWFDGWGLAIMVSDFDGRPLRLSRAGSGKGI